MADGGRSADRRWDQRKIHDFIRDHLTHVSMNRLAAVLEEVATNHHWCNDNASNLVSRICKWDPMQLLWSPCVSRGELETYAQRVFAGDAAMGLTRGVLVERIATYWTLRQPAGNPPEETWSDAAREYRQWEKKQKKKKKKSSRTDKAEDWDADTRGKKGANWSMEQPKHAPKSAAKTKKKKKKKPKAQEDMWPANEASPRPSRKAGPRRRPEQDINQDWRPRPSVRNQYPPRDNQPDILFRQVEAPTPPPDRRRRQSHHLRGRQGAESS